MVSTIVMLTLSKCKNVTTIELKGKRFLDLSKELQTFEARLRQTSSGRIEI